MYSQHVLRASTITFVLSGEGFHIQYDRQSLLFFTEKRRENLIFYNCAANFDILYLLVFTYDGKPFEVFVEMKKKAGMKYITWLSMAL